MSDSEVRIDKWLWAVRVYKTRSQAAEACKKGKVYVNGDQAKPSKIVKTDDVIEVKKPPVLYRYKVKELLDKRMSAKLVGEFVDDITPEQEVIKIDMMRLELNGYRGRGTGRPTKKERRLLEDWKSGDE